jgi:hypothetical protein
VHETRASERSYMLLGYLNTRPRTSHMLRVRNPNPAIGGLDDGHDPLDHGSRRRARGWPRGGSR